MPEFIMDKDGSINGTEFDDLSPFVQGYIECMLFTNCASGISMVEWEEPENQEAVREGQADGDIPTDSGFGDIHPDSFARMFLDCGDFQDKARHLLSQAYARGYEPVQAGRDFWFTRNGHGVGFWDREILEPREEWEALGSPRVDDPDWSKWQDIREGSLGNRLSAIAKEFGEQWVQFDPDEGSPTGYGFVHIHP